jgi:hypothetical protein
MDGIRRRDCDRCFIRDVSQVKFLSIARAADSRRAHEPRDVAPRHFAALINNVSLAFPLISAQPDNDRNDRALR